MPKVGNISIRANEHVFYNNVPLFFSMSEGFYMEVPEDLNDKFDALDRADLSKFHCDRKWNSKRDAGVLKVPHKRIVTGKTDEACIERMRAFICHLVSMSVSERDVIVVYFSNDRVLHHGRDYNKAHPRIGFSIALMYCKEVSHHGQKRPVYTTKELVPENYRMDSFREETKRVDVDERDAIIIEDTPENRAFLENTYGAFSLLLSRMSEFFKDGTSLKSLIALNPNTPLLVQGAVNIPVETSNS